MDQKDNKNIITIATCIVQSPNCQSYNFHVHCNSQKKKKKNPRTNPSLPRLTCNLKRMETS